MRTLISKSRTTRPQYSCQRRPSLGPGRQAFTSIVLCLVFRTNLVVGVVQEILPSGYGKSFSTSSYVWYGPQNKFINGSAVYLSGTDLCNPKREAVENKIVIRHGFRSGCSLGTQYIRLNDARAKAFITFDISNPPGLRRFQHDGWNRNSFTNENMVLVSVYTGGNNFFSLSAGSIFDKRENSLSDMILEIDHPHDKTYEKLFAGFNWAITMRVVAPVAAFYTAYIAAIEVLYSRSKKGVGYTICVVESFCSSFIGIVLACGQFGETILPFGVHVLFSNLIFGVSVITAILLALFIQEEGRHFRTGRPRRFVWMSFRANIVPLIIFLASVDVLVVILEIKSVYQVTSFVYLMHCISLSGLQMWVSRFFLTQAYKFQKPMKIYLMTKMSKTSTAIKAGRPTSNDRRQAYAPARASTRGPAGTSAGAPTGAALNQSAKVPRGLHRIGRLAFWLLVSGVCMPLTCVCLFIKVALMNPETGLEDPTGSCWLVVVFIFSMLRIIVSFSQVQAIRISSRRTAGCISWKCLSYSADTVAMNWTVPVSPDTSLSLTSQNSNSSQNSAGSHSSTDQSSIRSSFNLLPSPMLATIDEGIPYRDSPDLNPRSASGTDRRRSSFGPTETDHRMTDAWDMVPATRRTTS